MLADDHQLFIEGLCSILKHEIGIEIIGTAKNGLDLIQQIENGLTPEVILTDIRMPVMDGITVVKLLKNKFSTISIVALSMFDQETDVFEMLDAGAKGYIIKNAEKAELIEAIHTVANGGTYFSKKLTGVYQQWISKERVSTKIKLTRREKQILELIIKGRTSFQIAKELSLSRFTIDTHRKNIHKKTGIKSNVGLVRYSEKWL